MSYAQFHVNESERAARAAHAQLMRATAGGEGSTELYVYYKRMRLEALADWPTPVDRLEWTLAWGERVPTHLTVDQLIRWFAERSGQVPYLNP